MGTGLPNGCLDGLQVIRYRFGDVLVIGPPYRHVWWDCKELATFWTAIAAEVSKIMGTTVLFLPRIYVLHGFSGVEFNTSQKLLRLNLCVAASLLIPAKWKSPDSTSEDE